MVLSMKECDKKKKTFDRFMERINYKLFASCCCNSSPYKLSQPLNLSIRLSLSLHTRHSFHVLILHLFSPSSSFCRSQLGLLLPGGVHLSRLLRDPPQHPRRQQGQVLEPLPLGGPRGAGETTGAGRKRTRLTLFLWIVLSNSQQEREWMMNFFFKLREKYKIVFFVKFQMFAL